MEASIRLRPERQVPRYTSYPTAPHFHGGVSATTYESWLAKIGADEPTSLYIHVPYCRSMCWFCGCHTKIARRYQPIGDYVATLRAEIALVARSLRTRPLVTHLHWGGGTPTILTAADFLAITNDLAQIFDISKNAEIAIEIDPRTLTSEMIDGLQAAGVTRASLGVQDVNLHVQEAVNRIQPFEQTADLVAALRQAGIAEINLDLMYGLPNQRVGDVRKTVALATSLDPDRLAVFGYAHVPWMKAHQKMIDEAALPNAGVRLAQAEAIAEELTARGYRQIGLDHFARDGSPLATALESGRLRRNFQGYTNDQADHLLGFGASAIGTLDAGYVQNDPDIGSYSRAVKDGKLPTIRGLALDSDDRLRRHVIERLMCDMKIDLDALGVDGEFGKKYFAEELAALAEYSDDDLVEIDDAAITITPAGRPWMRVICAVFDTYLRSDQVRHSVAV